MISSEVWFHDKRSRGIGGGAGKALNAEDAENGRGWHGENPERIGELHHDRRDPVMEMPVGFLAEVKGKGVLRLRISFAFAKLILRSG